MDNVNIYNNDNVKCQFHIIYLFLYITCFYTCFRAQKSYMYQGFLIGRYVKKQNTICKNAEGMKLHIKIHR